MKYCWSNKGHFLEWKSANENVGESCHISSFRLLCKFTNKLPFINTCLIVSYQKWEGNWKSYLNSLFWHVYVSVRRDLCFKTCRKVACEIFIVWNILKIPVKKMRSPVLFGINNIVHSNSKILIPWQKFL